MYAVTEKLLHSQEHAAESYYIVFYYYYVYSVVYHQVVLVERLNISDFRLHNTLVLKYLQVISIR